MPARSSWKGFLNLSLVSVAVKAFSASGEGTKIRLNQLHAECNSRIQYAKKCPRCGDVPADEIVKGYEYAKDQYAVIEEKELDKLRADGSQRTIAVDKFVRPADVDPIYFSDSKYYLAPDGPAAQKGFALLRDAMQEMDLFCVAKVVLHNKEQLVAVRPFGNLFCMTILKYASQVKDPGQLDEELTSVDSSKEEQQLARTLVEQTIAEDFDLAEYQDEYTQNLTRLIDAKVNGAELVTPPAMEVPTVINLMDALKASVSKSAEAAAPDKKRAAIKSSGSGKKTSGRGASKRKSKPAETDSTQILAQQLEKPAPKRTRKKKNSAG